MTSPSIAGLVLAAGSSERMGPDRNKLVEEVGGRALVAIAVDALCGADIDPVFVVTGSEAQAVRACLADRDVRFLHHAEWQQGMGSSIAAGVRGVVETATFDGLLICVGDLPGLRAEWVGEVVAAFEAAFKARREEGPRVLAVAARAGRHGHPVLFGSAYFEALASLEGDRGGRTIVEAQRDRLVEVEIASDAIFQDVDTPAALAAARSRRDR
jgi:CTP:molybdopterin cytidylyltransferase MocA